MHKLAQEFNSYHDDDSELPLEEKFGTSMVVALRPWTLNVFEELRRPEKIKIF